MIKTYTIDDIRNLGPCYDPAEKIPQNWSGTIIDFLQIENVPPADKLWVVCHWLDDKTLRLFAVWCAREALTLVTAPDVDSIVVCDVAEKYAYGNATQEELAAAESAARSAASSDAESAALSAAWSAAWSAWPAAGPAARSASEYAAESAAESAAWSAAWSAWPTAGPAARSAARSAQVDYLTSLIRGDNA